MQNVDRGITGSSLAGSAILLEIGAEYGVIEFLQKSPVVDAAAASRSCGIKESVISAYLDSLSKAGIIEDLGTKAPATYKVGSNFDELINEVGYLSWALRACAPLINNAKEFSENNEEAQAKYPRSGGLVARTSKWMGEKSFYPQPENAIVAMAPKKIVDLGSGSGGFLIRMLRKIPGSTGVGIDLSPSATEQEEWTEKLFRAGFSNVRIEVLDHPGGRMLMASK